MSAENKGWEIWSQATEIISNADKDATLWDLAKAMYRYFNNRNMPIEEVNEYDLVYYHKEGRAPNGISWAVDISPEAIRDYLESMGFHPWRDDLKFNCYDLMDDYNSGIAISSLCRIYGVSRYIVEKIIKEFKHAEITGF